MVLLIGSLLAIFFTVVIIFTIQGGPYVPSDQKVVEDMVRAAGKLKGKHVADLGSGDGRIVMSAAKAGAVADGFEINPKLVRQSQAYIKKVGLGKAAHIYLRNMWKVDYSGYDVIFLYQIKHSMPWLEKKLQKELKKGSIIVSNYFQFPNWKPESIKDRVRVYKV